MFIPHEPEKKCEKKGVSNSFQLFSHAPLINARFDIAPHQQMSTRLCKAPLVKRLHYETYICVYVCASGRMCAHMQVYIYTTVSHNQVAFSSLNIIFVL